MRKVLEAILWLVAGYGIGYGVGLLIVGLIKATLLCE